MPDSLASLFPEKYVLLTTFPKTGVGVPTAVWAAQDGDALVATSVGSAGEVKRIRDNPAVTLQPCTMSGKVKKDAAPIAARAAIVDDPSGIQAGMAIIAKKYGWMFRMAFRAEERRTHGRAGASGRVILRITAA